MAEITWIKLKTNMFDDEKIKLLERLPDGDMILVVWIKLLAQAGKMNCGGYIMIAENIPMTVDEMAIVFNRPIEKVKFAIQALQRYGMIEIDENATIFISNWEKHQNIDGMEKIRLQNAERQKRFREKKGQKNLPSLESVDSNVTRNVTITLSNATDIDKEKEKEKKNMVKNVALTESVPNVSTSVGTSVSPLMSPSVSPLVHSTKKTPSEKSESASVIEQQFEEWWNLYDKKTQKKKAITAFKKVVKQYGYENLKTNTETFMRNFKGEKQYQPYPSTFLNNYHPEDELFKVNNNNNSINNTTQSHPGASQYKEVDTQALYSGGEWE